MQQHPDTAPGAGGQLQAADIAGIRPGQAKQDHGSGRMAQAFFRCPGDISRFAVFNDKQVIQIQSGGVQGRRIGNIGGRDPGQLLLLPAQGSHGGQQQLQLALPPRFNLYFNQVATRPAARFQQAVERIKAGIETAGPGLLIGRGLLTGFPDQGLFPEQVVDFLRTI